MGNWDYQGLAVLAGLLALAYLWRRRKAGGPSPFRNPLYWIVVGGFCGLYFLIGILIAIHGP